MARLQEANVPYLCSNGLCYAVRGFYRWSISGDMAYKGLREHCATDLRRSGMRWRIGWGAWADRLRVVFLVHEDGTPAVR